MQYAYLGLVEHRYEVKELEQCVGSCPDDCDVMKMNIAINEKRTENDVDLDGGNGMVMWWEELVRNDQDYCKMETQ